MENIKIRKSVRTYKNDKISSQIMEQLGEYIGKLEESYSGKFRFPIVNSNNDSDGKIGTYGIIKGARYYICGIVKKDSMDLLYLGYAFEKIILFATSLGLGTCWLGGTFNRSNFGKAANVADNEMFIVASPIGHIEDKKSFVDSTMRKLAKSDNRKPWDALFFHAYSSKPLEENILGAFGDALEMVRLAPSASNKQPWRIVKDNDRYDFFLQRTSKYATSLGFDIQLIDIGIALCHFETALNYHGIEGKFEKLASHDPKWENSEYIISWII